MGPLVSRLGAFFGLLALITLSLFVRFSKIKKVSKSKLKLFLSNVISFVNIFSLKIEQHMYKFVCFFGTPGILSRQSYNYLKLFRFLWNILYQFTCFQFTVSV